MILEVHLENNIQILKIQTPLLILGKYLTIVENFRIWKLWKYHLVVKLSKYPRSQNSRNESEFHLSPHIIQSSLFYGNFCLLSNFLILFEFLSFFLIFFIFPFLIFLWKCKFKSTKWGVYTVLCEMTHGTRLNLISFRGNHFSDQWWVPLLESSIEDFGIYVQSTLPLSYQSDI